MMPAEKHTFDPDGDLLLQLAHIGKKKVKRQAREVSMAAMDSSVLEGLALDEPANNDDESEHFDADESSAILKEGNKQRIGGSFAITANESHDHDEDEEIFPDVVEVPMLVSSRHMSLPSPVFKAMLQHDGFKEGHILGSKGSGEVPLPDDDPRAMTILLDVIHGRNRRVPRKVSLRMLAAIAVLADKYQMVEALESSDTWINQLRPKLPTEYITAEDEKLIFRWMEIAWVFGKAEEFKAMTCAVEKGVYSDLDSSVVGICPVPSIIIDTIMECREDALHECYSLIEHTIRRYQRPEVLCSRGDDENLRLACDSMLLGSLLKSSSSQGLYPSPKEPYSKMSFDDLAPLLSGHSVQALCDHVCLFYMGDELNEAHGLKDLVEEKISDIYERLSGLDDVQKRA